MGGLAYPSPVCVECRLTSKSTRTPKGVPPLRGVLSMVAGHTHVIRRVEGPWLLGRSAHRHRLQRRPCLGAGGAPRLRCSGVARGSRVSQRSQVRSKVCRHFGQGRPSSWVACQRFIHLGTPRCSGELARMRPCGKLEPACLPSFVRPITSKSTRTPKGVRSVATLPAHRSMVAGHTHVIWRGRCAIGWSVASFKSQASEPKPGATQRVGARSVLLVLG